MPDQRTAGAATQGIRGHDHGPDHCRVERAGVVKIKQSLLMNDPLTTAN